MLKIGITGNIGTGKTTVCKVFETLGIAVYYADTEAKKFYQDPEVILAVKEEFGGKVFDNTGLLIPRILAELVFPDPAQLKKLNNIIHPRVLDDLLSWADQNHNSQYLLYESALLFESGFVKHFDKSILVTAPAALAQKRVMQRDQMSETDFMARAANQLPQDEKEQLANFIINNDGDKAVIPQVMNIHQFLLESARAV